LLSISISFVKKEGREMIGIIVYVDGREYDIIGKKVNENTYKCPHCGNSTFGPRISEVLRVNDMEAVEHFSSDVLSQIKIEANLVLAGKDENIRCGTCFSRELEDAFG
jgi:hypothetical protein